MTPRERAIGYIEAIKKRAKAKPVSQERSDLVEVFRALDALREYIDELAEGGTGAEK